MARTSDTITWSTRTQTGIEGNPIALGSITGSWTSIRIGGLPVGAVLEDGAGHMFIATSGAMTVDVTGWNLNSLVITPASDANFTLTAMTGGGKSVTDVITVNPLAPSIDLAPTATGTEGAPIALGALTVSVNGLPADGNGNTLKSLIVSGIPTGVTISDDAGHSFTATRTKKAVDVSNWSLSNLSAKSANDTNFTLTITATERDAEGNTSSTKVTEQVIINPLAPTIGWAPAPAAGLEGSAISLGAIGVTVNKLAGDGSGNTLQSIVIDSVPVGATLTDGHGHSFVAAPGATSVDVTGWTLSSLAITPVSAANFTLQVTATERDAEGNINSASASETVIVNPLAPSITAAPVMGNAGTPIALGIDVVAGGLPGEANAVQSLVISGIPVGAVVADGNGHSFTATASATSVDVAGWSRGSLTITPASTATFSLTLTAIETDIDGNISSATATQQVTADVPIDHAPTISAGAPDAALVEAGNAADGSALAGTSTSVVQLAKGDAETGAVYDTTGWTGHADGTWTKAGVYGTATLNVNTDTLAYQLDNGAAATNALAVGQAASDSFVIKVGEVGGPLTASTQVSFAIAGTNDAPVIVSAVVNGALTDSAAADSFADLTGTLAATDAEGDVLTYGLAAGQSGTGAFGALTVDVAGNWAYVANASAIGALPAGASVADSFVLQVADGNGGIATQTLTVNIAGANDTPVFTSAVVNGLLADTAAADSFAGLAGSLAASDAEGNALTFGLAAGQDGVGAYGTLSLDPSGNWSYSANAASIDALPAGAQVADAFTVQVDDGFGGVSLQTLNIHITGANDAPVILTAAQASVAENTTIVANLSGYDPEGQNPVSFAISGGADAALFDIVNGQLVFKAAPNFATDPHSYAVDITASDGAATTTQSMAIGLVPGNGAQFTVIDPSQASAQAPSIINAIMGSIPGITADPLSLQMVAGPTSTMYYDGSLTGLGAGHGLLITSGTVPNTANTVGYFGQDNGMAGDPALDAVVNAVFQTMSYDATTIAYSFTVTDPNITGISLNAVFGTDEYPEWVDAFVDIGVVLVNGVNVAYFGNDPNAPLSVINANLAANYFIDNTGNLTTSSFGGVAVPGMPSTLPIEYDGVSHPLTIYAPVHQGVNTIEIGIADTGDHIYDSGLFISSIQATNAPVSGVVLDVPCTDSNDDLTGTDASESFIAKNGDDVINAMGGNDIVLGGDGNDILAGGAGDDYLDGGTGGNTLNGGDGNDTIKHAGSGADHIDGGSGVNKLILDLSASAAGQHVDFSDPTVAQVLGDGTVVVNMQALDYFGGAGSDVVFGGFGNDMLNGGAGDDVLGGAAGADDIAGGDGFDLVVFSGSASDYLVATIGIDLYQVTDLRAFAPDGVDTLSGVEQLQFSDGAVSLAGQVAVGVVIQGTVQDDFINPGQTVAGQPLPTNSGDMIFGDDGDDHIQGGDAADFLYGEAANDFIFAGAGDDMIVGGAGKDELKGELGGDLFVFVAPGDSEVGAEDTILDFSTAQGDKIDLSQIDAISGVADSSFTYVGNFSGMAGQLIAVHSGDGYLVQGDVTGDGLADFAIQVDTNAALMKTDFFL